MIKTNNPMVSVIIPSYNHEKYIQECINSVRKQTYKNIELIIIDDGSTDNSVYLIEECIKDIDLKTIFIKKNNEGVSKTLNKGLEQKQGELICFLASDDVWAPNKIIKQVEFMFKNPEVALVFTDAFFIKDGDKTKIKYSNYKTKLKKLFVNNSVRTNLYYTLLSDNIIPAGSVMIKSSILADVGCFDEKSPSEDFDFWLRISKKYSIGYIDSPLYYYRLHDSNQSSNSFRMISATLRALRKQFNEPPLKGKLVKQAIIVFKFYFNISIYKIKKIKIRKENKNDI